MKKIYSCKVNGNLGRRGKRAFACCGYNIVSDNSRCGAHGNLKCEHKVKGLINGKVDE